MPTKPPITHASWQVVSLRPKALAWTGVGTSLLDGRVQGELRDRLGQPGDQPEQRQRHTL